MSMCIYNGCTSVQKPCSRMAFFNLPKDSRRLLWIANSGNQQLATLPLNARRVVCEKHFSSNSFRKQFNRTLLIRDAVPIKWHRQMVTETLDPEDNGVSQDEKGKKYLLDCLAKYEDTFFDDTECSILEYDLRDNDDGRLESIDGEHPVANVNIIENQDMNIEEISLLGSIQSDNEIDDDFPSAFDEVEIETIEPSERRIDVECSSESVSIDENCSKKNSIITRTSQQSSVDINCLRKESVACDVPASSSTPKPDGNSDATLKTVEEDKYFEDRYFALSLVGILQRIPRQKRSFAKVNILKYLTELEYGQDSSLN